MKQYSSPGVEQPAPVSESSTVSGAASNQDRLAALDLPGVDELAGLAGQGLDWLGQAAAESGAGFDTRGGLIGFISDGLGLTDRDGRYQQELVNELMLEHDLEHGVAVAWATALAEGRISDAECWPPLQRALLDFKPRADQAADVLQAIDLLFTAEAQDRPADALRHFGTIFEALTTFMPYVPVMSEWLAVFGKVLGQAADRLDELARLFRLRDSKVAGLVYDGAHSGSRALTSYLKALRRGEIAPPSEGIVEWVMANTDGLRFAIGEGPPVQKREVFGVDFLAADEIDLADLTTWFCDHLWAIARYAWGEDEVNETWGQGED